MKNTLCELLDQATILGHRKTTQEIVEYLESCGVIVCRQDELPTADVQPVKRGVWKECENGLNKYCSYCNKVHGTIYNAENFCPNCGALMQEEE